jgi:hypothetical protein
MKALGTNKDGTGVGDDDDYNINLRPRGMVTRPPEGYKDMLS